MNRMRYLLGRSSKELKKRLNELDVIIIYRYYFYFPVFATEFAFKFSSIAGGLAWSFTRKHKYYTAGQLVVLGVLGGFFF